MSRYLVAAGLLLLLVIPNVRADNVTVHNTIGLLETQLCTKDGTSLGVMEVWNTQMDMNLLVKPKSGYSISKVYIYMDTEPAPAAGGDCVEPEYGEWPYTEKFKKLTPTSYPLTVHLADLAGLEWGQWGEPWVQKRLVTVAARIELKTSTAVPVTTTVWAINPFVPLDSQRTAWGDNAYALRYELQHPKHGTISGPIHGLGYSTPTHGGIIEEEGGYSFFPEETVTLYIGEVEVGEAAASQRLTPLDVFPNSSITDTEVVNFARLLLTLDEDQNPQGGIQIGPASASILETTMLAAQIEALDFGNADDMDYLFEKMGSYVSVVADADDAADWLVQAVGGQLIRRNISKSPLQEVDKPKLDIMPVWVPARTASGQSTTVEYTELDGDTVTRNKVKPIFVTYTEMQDPNVSAGIVRGGRDIITAVSMDDGATWKRFNVSHMAGKSSFKLDATGERFPGDSRGPRQRIVADKIMVVWTSAYARGGKPSFAIKTDDDYQYDDEYAVNDVWGVRGRQGSVDYDEDKDVGDQEIGEIPYYALWACRGILVWDGNANQYPDNDVGDVIWFKPERLTSGRRDANFAMCHGAKNVGFAIAWQEDPGGLLPGSCKGGGHGWSGATVHKKTDIWYSYLKYSDFALIDTNFVVEDHGEDELGGTDEHGQQPEISNRPKWLVPMSLPVRVSDNNTVNTHNLKVELNPDTGLPWPGYTPLEGATEEDYLATEHENEGGCDDADDSDHVDGDGDHGGAGGGWGMARYAYMLTDLELADTSLDSTVPIWEKYVDGDYRPVEDEDGNITRWYRFYNKPGVLKTVLVTPDGRPLDGDTGACRPAMFVMSGGWVILGYEETKGLGIPPEGEHGEDDDTTRPVPDDSGKNIIYHSFKLDNPDLVSAGKVVNLPALDDSGNLIPIYYRDADGEVGDYFRQYKTETARRVRFIPQPKSWLGSSRTSMMVVYKQGREGSGKPSDVFAVRAVVPAGDPSTANPYRFENFQRYSTGAEATDADVMRGYRRHKNMSSATVESMDPTLMAADGEGNSWYKVGKWKQYQGDLGDESYANPYSDAKAHRGFLRGDYFVFGYSFTPNWGRLGGDHMDFYVRRSFNGGQTFTTDPGADEDTVTVHTVIERDPETGEYSEKQYQYGPGAFEPGRNVTLLKGNSHTVVDPRLVPPMGPGTLNPTYEEDDTAQNRNDPGNYTYYVAFGTGRVLHGIGEPMGVEDTVKEDILYSRTTDGGQTWLRVPWVINPESESPNAGETIYRWPWLAHGAPHQGHAQIRMHPSGTRLYAIWHQWTDGDEAASPHDVGNDIWFRRIDFME